MKQAKEKPTQICSPSNKKSRRSDSVKSSEVISVSSSESSGKSKAPVTSPVDLSSWEVKKSICRYFIENGHDFSVACSPSFKKMISLCSGKLNSPIPSVEEFKGSIFKDVVKEMDDYVRGIKKSWAETGCSILLDEWTDSKGRNLVTVLVDCPKGTIYHNSYDVSDKDMNAMQQFFQVILKEVGINNIVQVITTLASSPMNEVGKRLTDKFRSIFWTLSASSCIGIMLEKISAIDHIKATLDKAEIITSFIYSCSDVLEYLRDKTYGRDLVKPFRTRSALPFLTLENILLEKDILKNMFLSSDPMSSILTSSNEGKKVAELMEDRSFWSGALTAVNAAIPLVRVIELMNENDKAQMGYIYETIDQAKETIKEEFSHKKPNYMPYWKVIDDVWSEKLHSPLHSAGYFLNPNLFYSSDFAIDPEVATGLLCCIVRSSEDVRVHDRMIIQIEQYRNAKGSFSEGRDTDPRSVSPADWWSIYGKDCPELQRLAVRILSQTCDGASIFQLERSLAETLLEKQGTKPNEQKELRDMTYLRYNIMLQNMHLAKA